MKVYQFDWSREYGGGLMLVAANSQDEANEMAKDESRWWEPDGDWGDRLVWNGEPQIICEAHYQE